MIARADPADAGSALRWLDACAAQGREADGIAAADSVLQQMPEAHELRWRVAIAQHRAGRIEDAVQNYGLLARAQPTVGLFYNLGLAYQAQGRPEAAAGAFEHALAMDPAHADSHMGLASIIEEIGRPEEALIHYDRAVELNPGHWIAYHNRGWLLRAMRRAEEAIDSFARAVAAAPEAPEAQFSLGSTYAALDRNGPALGPLEKAIALRPDYPEALANLGAVYRVLRRPYDAVQVLQRCLALQPDNAGARNNLSMCWRDLGMVPEMLGELRRAVRMRPNDPEIHSNLIFGLQYDPAATGETLLAEARSWAAKFSRPPVPVASLARQSDGRVLRIGYLSGDFRNHAAGFFLEPLIAGHDRTRFHITCYFDYSVADEVTDRIRSRADVWRDVRGLTDEALGRQIQADGIDILVECTGHTGGNRLVMLSGRVAPIQVTTLLGHGGTTGVDAIDYLLGDASITPVEAAHHFSEQIVCLPFFAPFRVRDSWPAVGPLPDGPPVFACVGDPARVSDEVMEAWRALLDEIPDARLILKHWSYGEAALQDHWRRRYERLGPRVAWEGVPDGWSRNMSFYDRIWAVLDTWPANGGSSSIIPLWMGVPVISLSGGSCGQRFGRSVLTAIGLSELVAEAPSDLVRKAAWLVSDRECVAALRVSLRDRLARSPICDAALVVEALERAFRDMWNQFRIGTGDGTR